MNVAAFRNLLFGRFRSAQDEPVDDAGPPRPWRARLRDWWHGEDLPEAPKAVLARAAVAETAAPEAPAEIMTAEQEWALGRVALAEQLWDNDFMTPGGLDYFLELTKPLGVNPSMHVLDLSAQLGGAVRGLVERWGTWVTGLERSPEIAEIAQKRSFQRSLGAKAPIKPYNPENVTLKPNTYNRAYAREAFFLIEGKVRFFKVVAEALKSGGHLMFTDYVVTATNRPRSRPGSPASRRSPMPGPLMKPWSACRTPASTSGSRTI